MAENSSCAPMDNFEFQVLIEVAILNGMTFNSHKAIVSQNETVATLKVL